MKLSCCLSKAVAAVCLAALLCSCGAALPGGSGSSGGSFPSWPGSSSGDTSDTGPGQEPSGEDVSLPDDLSTVGLNVTRHTQSEIIQYIKSSSASFSDPVEFAEPSSISSQIPGRLSQETKDSALAILNQFRFIAGLNYNVTWDDSLDRFQQAACLVNAMNGNISHTPDRPAGISDELYADARSGAGTSNLGAGYQTLNWSLLGYMADVDVSSLGHRRWCLAPSMKVVSMGAVPNSRSQYRNFYSMYAFGSASGGSNTTVVWPAQVTPIEYFNNPSQSFDNGAFWSLSLGRTVNKDSVRVIVQQKNGRTWEFSSETSGINFAVDNGNYGQTGCIMFRPNVVCRAGDEFLVTVILKGEPAAIQYTVSFFQLSN